MKTASHIILAVAAMAFASVSQATSVSIEQEPVTYQTVLPAGAKLVAVNNGKEDFYILGQSQSKTPAQPEIKVAVGATTTTETKALNQQIKLAFVKPPTKATVKTKLVEVTKPANKTANKTAKVKLAHAVKLENKTAKVKLAKAAKPEAKAMKVKLAKVTKPESKAVKVKLAKAAKPENKKAKVGLAKAAAPQHKAHQAVAIKVVKKPQLVKTAHAKPAAAKLASKKVAVKVAHAKPVRVNHKVAKALPAQVAVNEEVLGTMLAENQYQQPYKKLIIVP